MGMEMPKPAAEMTKLDWMVGDWSVKETHEATPWSPGGTGQGTMEIDRGPGGFSQVMEYESSGPMGTVQGRALMAWDAQAGVYRIAWTDNMTPGIVMSECRDEGKDLVCTGEGSMGGKTYSMRSRAANPNPQGWTEVFETSMDGGPYQKTMTLEYQPEP